MPDETEATVTPPATEAAAVKSEAEAPTHPDVLAMDRAFTGGDFHEAQAIARRLVATDDDALKAVGRAMLARFELDTRVLAVLAFTGVLVLVLAGMYLGHR